MISFLVVYLSTCRKHLILWTKIFLSKLNHYGIKGIPYECFKRYFLTNRQQFKTDNNRQSELSNIEFGMPQGSILAPLVHHFADDTNILYVSSSLKDIKKINHDLSNLVQWLRANKISLNVSKIYIYLSHIQSRPLNILTSI